MVATTAAIVLTLFVALTTVVVMRSRARSQQRERDAREALEHAGFAVSVPKDERERGEVFSRLGPARYLAGGASGVRWCAQGDVDGHHVTLALHRHGVDRDDSVEFVHTTVAATPCPVEWPLVRVVPRSVGSGAPGPVLENAEFRDGFRVETLDDDFALLALTPESQGLIVALAGEFRDPVVGLGEGALAVAVPGALDAAGLIDLARRIGELRATIRPMVL